MHVGIDEDSARKRLLFRAVMVDHDRVDTLRFQVRQLIVRVRSAVQGNEQIRLAGLQRPVDGSTTQPVALFKPPGHHEARVEIEAP